ncbi:MAG: ribosome maturation factor RimP [Eubacterium sp.]|jgi:ribosome maturation factor RimP|nr:ribosome maturation factor RimP [Eubacterium sp.]
MKKQDIEKRTEELVQDIIDSGGYELWDVEYVKEGSDYYLRVYADKEGGIMIDDCVTISRALEAKLDAEDFIEEAYILEVSSPGLTRKLKKDKDYDRSIGKLVFVKLYKAEQGAKEFVGRLKEVDDKLLKLDIDGDEVVLDRNNISSARLEYED